MSLRNSLVYTAISFKESVIAGNRACLMLVGQPLSVGRIHWPTGNMCQLMAKTRRRSIPARKLGTEMRPNIVADIRRSRRDPAR